MELVFPLHAAWVWNNYFSLSLSLPLSSFFSLSTWSLFFSILLCCDLHPPWVSGTVHHSVRTAPSTSCSSSALSPPLSLPLPCSPPPPLSVVYQDGFYGAADLYVSKFTSNRHTISVPPLTAFSCSFFFFPSWGDSACVSGHALHRAASIMVNGENSLEARHATYLHKILCLLCMSVIFRRQTCWLLSHNWAPAVFI